ncbi:MAG: 3-deoxy-D-manno-octulosonic acid transferase [Xanthomonadales bacterium]|nr:3-deoxy-D-manno-octulosonic acid transferase [Xanthomonadales bacterium]
MRALYSLLLLLAVPLVLLYFGFRGLRSPDYLKRWPERFAFFEAPKRTGGILVHAVSMGEVNAASALVRELLRRYPGDPLFMTAFTPTGSERIRTLFGDTVAHRYSPLDLPGTVRRFLDRVQPRLLIVMETEIWPNLYHEAASRGIPILIANARISDRSLPRYRRFRRLTAETLGLAARIAAQSERDATRLEELGARPERLVVTGNLKFDVRLPPGLVDQGESLRLAWGTSRPVFLAGSTHEGDEEAVLRAFAGVLASSPKALLVLVPRHPERFGRAESLARSAGLSVSLRSTGIACSEEQQCLLVDTMGELLNFYAACDVAFVGGSFEPIGGHNVLEPAALAKPVLVGPHTFNFQDITEQLIDCGAAQRADDAAALESALVGLFGDPERRDRMGRAGQALVKSGQGALDRTLEEVVAVLTPEAG